MLAVKLLDLHEQIKIDDKEKAAIEKNMRLFLTRDLKFSPKEAAEEVDILNDRIGMVTFVNKPELYLKISRAGASKRLNRKERVGIQASLENAVNHALAISRKE